MIKTILSVILIFALIGMVLAVVRKLGKIEKVRTPGTYFDLYMINEYEVYDTKVQQVEELITEVMRF